MPGVWDSVNHYGDMVAIPFFIFLCAYFYEKVKTPVEWILFAFCFGALIVDVLLTMVWIRNLKK